MSKTITGTFQKPDGTAVAFGTLYLKLIQDATVIGTGQIVPATPLAFPLDANGTLGSGVTIFASDELTPSGISYVLTVSENGGGQVYGPEFFIISGVSPINLNNLTPSANSPVVFSGAVLLNPTALQTITGFPLAAPAFQSPTANPSATGIVRLATGDSINWRNNANSADILLSKDISDRLRADLFAGIVFVGGGGLIEAGSHAATGSLQLLSTSSIGWRNNANSGDITLSKTTGDLPLFSSGGPSLLLNAQANAAAIVGTGAPATVYTYTLPASTVATLKGIRVTIGVNHSTGTASVTYALSLNGIAVESTGSASTGAAVAQYELLSTAATTGTWSRASTFFGTSPNTGTLAGLAWTSSQVLTLTFNVAATDQVTPIQWLVELIQ